MICTCSGVRIAAYVDQVLFGFKHNFIFQHFQYLTGTYVMYLGIITCTYFIHGDLIYICVLLKVVVVVVVVAAVLSNIE